MLRAAHFATRSRGAPAACPSWTAIFVSRTQRVLEMWKSRRLGTRRPHQPIQLPTWLVGRLWNGLRYALRQEIRPPRSVVQRKLGYWQGTLHGVLGALGTRRGGRELAYKS